MNRGFESLIVLTPLILIFDPAPGWPELDMMETPETFAFQGILKVGRVTDVKIFRRDTAYRGSQDTLLLDAIADNNQFVKSVGAFRELDDEIALIAGDKIVNIIVAKERENQCLSLVGGDTELAVIIRRGSFCGVTLDEDSSPPRLVRRQDPGPYRKRCWSALTDLQYRIPLQAARTNFLFS